MPRETASGRMKWRPLSCSLACTWGRCRNVALGKPFSPFCSLHRLKVSA